MNKIDWQPKALKQLRKLDRPRQQQIVTGVRVLKDFPHCANVKKLIRHTYPYRLRVGDYRVFFEFDSQVCIVRIEEVRKRHEHTY
ncbi:phage protein [Nitrosococcus halophilus Nc 4]|uniref:Phage protein n=1 Tax=Nitrosococcus halophilus (strain Nc4) TaxID=472759 RepID=D5BYW8_NITHN|nr:type II toxin-antitoxin system RelE/ParE family toxin [Nitrosococcus halophilus]ADE14181.1 phage protein [Nitrosococcus halophilus Nc 4]